MMNLFSIFNKKRYWYSVRYIYKDSKSNLTIFDFRYNIGFRNQTDVLNLRKIKKAIQPLHMFDASLIKDNLCNGYLGAEVDCYLGRF